MWVKKKMYGLVHSMEIIGGFFYREDVQCASIKYVDTYRLIAVFDLKLGAQKSPTHHCG